MSGQTTLLLLLRLVLVAALATGTAAEFSGLLGLNFEHAEDIRAAFMEDFGFENITCSGQAVGGKQDADARAERFLDDFVEVVGTDTIRPMSMANMRNVGVRRRQTHFARLTNQMRSSRMTDRKAQLMEQGKLETCAIIGNSGHLKATSYGANIDQFDIVARGNQAPIKGYEQFVGSKTTMRFLNEAMTYRYKNSITWAMGAAFQSCLQDYYNRAMAGVRRFPMSKGTRFWSSKSRASLWRRRLQQFGAEPPQEELDARMRLSISSRLSESLKRRNGPLATSPKLRAAVSIKHQAPESPAAAPPVRQVRVQMPPAMLRRAQDSCKSVLSSHATESGRLTEDAIKFEDWLFPLERGVVLTHISEFKLIPADHRMLAGHFRTLRRDVKSAIVNYPVSFLAEDIIKKWTDFLVCQETLPAPGGTRPTTGFTMLLSLLPVCEKVVMYGFGPPSGNPPNGTDYHFFQSMLSRSWQTTSSDVHNFKAEYLFIKSLARRGRLVICNNANSPQCGLNDENLDAKQAAMQTG